MAREQEDIIRSLGVPPTFNAVEEARRRIEFLKSYLMAAKLKSYVLGISGGVDSLTAALLAQTAVLELRQSSKDAEFVALRLPYGRQADEEDAAEAIRVIAPDRVLAIDIKRSSDAMMRSLHAGGFSPNDHETDFLLGNIKARQRMIAQFAVASGYRGLVIGTDHAAEAVMGFFTKYGDGAADILPLAGLNKRRVRALATHLGAPEHLIFKVPTADLETDKPLRPDEEVYGVTYEQIDDFLEGRAIDKSAEAIIISAYTNSMHKRALPVAAGEFEG